MANEINDILAQLDAATQNYVVNGYNALASHCASSMAVVIVAYIAWIGWKTINGWQGFSAGNFVKEALKIAVIYSIATNWGFFTTYIYNVLTNTPNELAGILMQSTGSSYDSANTALQTVFTQGIEEGQKIWAQGEWRHPFDYLLALNMWVVVGILTGVAITMIGIAKIFLAMLIVLAPVFIYFLLSESFKGVTESWLKLTIGFALVPLLVDSALLFTNNILSLGIQRIDNIPLDSSENAGQLLTAIILFDIGISLCCILLYKSAEIAAQIGGGMAIATQTHGMINHAKARLTGIPRSFGQWTKAKEAEKDKKRYKSGGKP